MPYYSWQGITIHGATKKGVAFSTSLQELDETLLKRDIALLRGKPARKPLLQRSISAELKIEFFRQIAVLLQAGVLLPETLLIVNERMNHPQLQEVIADIAKKVHEGQPLSQALKDYPKIFSPLMIQMIFVGQEAGTLALSLTLLADHLEMMQSFYTSMRSAAIMPCVTLLFFCAVALIIIVGIIPQFASMFATFGQELPTLTRMLINASSVMRSWYMVMVAIALFFCALLAKNAVASEQGRTTIDRWLVRLPYIGILIKQSSLLSFLRSMALLLESGMPVPRAIYVAQQAVPNSVLRNQIDYILQEVEGGTSLSSAMAHHPDELFGQDIIAIVKVGEESGKLPSMLARSAASYQERIKQSLAVATTLFQPLLMIILGLLITMLIFAVYLPVVQFSQMVR